MATTTQPAHAFTSGLLGGAVGVIVMDATMERTRELLRLDSKPSQRAPAKHEGDEPGAHHRPDEPATEALGRLAYETITGREPDEDTRARLGTAIHWSYGLAVGGLYGLLRGRRRWLIVDAVAGVSYGAGLWALGDNLAVPRLGLAPKPTRYGPRMHLHTLIGHLAYGLATAASTRVAERLIARVAERLIAR
jgi:hypothetical protein